MTQDFIEDFRLALNKENAQYILIVSNDTLTDTRVVWSADSFGAYQHILTVAERVTEKDFEQDE